VVVNSGKEDFGHWLYVERTDGKQGRETADEVEGVAVY